MSTWEKVKVMQDVNSGFVAIIGFILVKYYFNFHYFR